MSLTEGRVLSAPASAADQNLRPSHLDAKQIQVKPTRTATPARTAKALLRTRIRAALHSLSRAEREARAAAGRARLRRQPLWREAGAILFYAPVGDELDLWPLLLGALTEGKTVALPRFVAAASAYEAAGVSDPARDLRPGRFGIREPGPGCPAIPLNRLDLILVPGIAFDLCGHRLGRGQGFYDRLLSRVSGLKCGVAFDEQVVPALPVEPHDVRVDCILTPTRWLRLSPRAVLK